MNPLALLPCMQLSWSQRHWGHNSLKWVCWLNVFSKTPLSSNTKHFSALMQTFGAGQMALNTKVMLSYHKWTYGTDICGSSLELMSHVVWGGGRLNIRLGCNPQCSAPFKGPTHSTLSEHSPPTHTKFVKHTLKEDWSVLQYLTQRGNLCWGKSNLMLNHNLSFPEQTLLHL